MSRRIDRPARVATDRFGVPTEVDGEPVRRRHDHWREWIGIHDGDPQRDVWLVETDRGICELHYLCHPDGDDDLGPGRWLVHAWRD